MALNSGKDITENMANWIIEELRFKAMIYEYSGTVALYNGDVTKSNTLIPMSLLDELRTATKVLEYENFELRFYHPGSMKKQRDLIAMALYPLVYGKSRILPDRTIRLDEALQNAGQGEVIPIPKETGITREDIAWRVSARADIQVRPYSRYHQVLPTDWELGDDERWHIATYINNLHPVKHRNIYKLIEDTFNCIIPQWDVTLTPMKDMLHSRARIEYGKAQYEPLSAEALKQAPEIHPREAQSEYEERCEKWRMKNYRAIQPDAGEFIPWAVPPRLMSKLPEDLTSTIRVESTVELNRDYRERGLQVVTRILGVDLTPEDPYYQTEWHVEGQMVGTPKHRPIEMTTNSHAIEQNEHVCAAAFCTFAIENMEDPVMEIRNNIETSTLAEVEHEPNDFVWLRQVFGLENGEPAIQCSGSIRCGVGRSVIFPSIIQHRLTGFELKDKTKPGTTRAVVFYLVDPNIRIISTANVPPQRLDWTLELEPRDGEDLKATVERVMLENRDKKGRMPMSLNDALKTRMGLLEELLEFMKYQHVAFESNVISL